MYTCRRRNRLHFWCHVFCHAPHCSRSDTHTHTLTHRTCSNLFHELHLWHFSQLWQGEEWQEICRGTERNIMCDNGLRLDFTCHSACWTRIMPEPMLAFTLCINIPLWGQAGARTEDFLHTSVYILSVYICATLKTRASILSISGMWESKCYTTYVNTLLNITLGRSRNYKLLH